ncbi:ABC transporter permease [Lysobacter lacus]|uniref:ABC transporter permease n=2 Tax=Cognatilysobacter lacus TaxID=1643323 RepID=A0A5D8ZB05_9GAMM|nr:ABC transporter permease [Lysobacter lacus]
MSHASPERALVSQWRLAFRDVVEGLRAHRVWSRLARMDIKQRYRRSILGPFWITITMIVFIAAVGPLYGVLLGIPTSAFLPYVAMGLISWGLVSTLILEGTTTFLGAEDLVRSVKLPFTVHVMRMLYRNLIMFAHNLLAFVPFMLYLRVWPHWQWLMAIPGVALILMAALPAAFLLGTVCARYRDMQQIVASLVQLSFFVTPIFWKPELLKSRQYLADYNPFHLLLESVRGPVVGEIPSAITYVKIVVIILVLYIAATPFFVRYRRRLSFWV